MMRRIVLLLVSLFCAAPMAWAQQGGEQLFLVPPQGWIIAYHDQKGGTELTELVPPGQNAQDWTDMLTVELIQGKPAMDVQSTFKARLEAIHQGCENIGAGPPQLGAENGYETGVRAFACPRDKRWGKGQISLYKVILGRDRTYVVSRAWSGQPFDTEKMPLPAQATDEWLKFMARVVVCDPRDRSHPCPTK